jgi:hypothetical protein
MLFWNAGILFDVPIIFMFLLSEVFEIWLDHNV